MLSVSLYYFVMFTLDLVIPESSRVWYSHVNCDCSGIDQSEYHASQARLRITQPIVSRPNAVQYSDAPPFHGPTRTFSVFLSLYSRTAYSSEPVTPCPSQTYPRPDSIPYMSTKLHDLDTSLPLFHKQLKSCLSRERVSKCCSEPARGRFDVARRIP